MPDDPDTLRALVERIGCTACGGSGYVAAYHWLDCQTSDRFKPDEPSVVYPCRCNPLRARIAGEEG